MSDNSASWHLNSNGNWTRKQRNDAGQPLVDVQDEFMRRMVAKKSRN